MYVSIKAQCQEIAGLLFFISVSFWNPSMLNTILDDSDILFLDNDMCPAPDTTGKNLIASCANGSCQVACESGVVTALKPNNILCSHLGVWNNMKPHENLVLPGCSSKNFARSYWPNIFI